MSGPHAAVLACRLHGGDAAAVARSFAAHLDADRPAGLLACWAVHDGPGRLLVFAAFAAAERAEAGLATLRATAADLGDRLEPEDERVGPAAGLLTLPEATDPPFR